MKRWLPLTTVTALLVALVLAVHPPAHTALNTYTARQLDRWDFTAFPVQFSVNTNVGSNVLGGGGAAVAAVTAGFNTWNHAPNASISVSRGSDVANTAAAFDGINLVCFVCQGDFSQDISTLAVTISTTSDAVGEDTHHGGTSRFVGQILDADILFNPAVTWSTSGQPTGDQQDLQTVATHEIGHFLGLDHSAVVRAVMFPFAPPIETTLSYDDVAAVANAYAKSTPDYPTGSISGTIHFVAGMGVFGAHVFADSSTNSGPAVSGIRKSTISTLSRSDGTYTITGLPADTYAVGVEPLDQPATNADIASYAQQFGNGAQSVQTNFNTRFH
jgi:hypothetical protein